MYRAGISQICITCSFVGVLNAYKHAEICVRRPCLTPFGAPTLNSVSENGIESGAGCFGTGG